MSTLRYCDQNGYPAWQNVPGTWGAPFEGDGLAAARSTASATTSLNLTGASATAGNVFSVMGASLTCVASGAGNNQFNAGSGAALATALADAINRQTNTVTVAAQAAGWSTGIILFRQVYARATGATLELMTRAGSAVYNGLTAATWTGMTGMPAAPTWAGGVSGCWGYLMPNSTDDFGGYAQPWQQGYGCMFGLTLAGSRPSDMMLWIRARDNVLRLTSGELNPLPAEYFVDANNEFWPDTLGKTFTIASAGSNLYFSGATKLRANVRDRFIFLMDSTFTGGGTPNASFLINAGWNSTGDSLSYDNVRFRDSSVRGLLDPFYQGRTGGRRTILARRCTIEVTRSNDPQALGNGPQGGQGSWVHTQIEDCDIVYSALTGAHPGFFTLGGHCHSVSMANCRLTSGASFFPPFRAGEGSTGKAFADNLVGFSLQASGAGLAWCAPFAAGADSACITIQNLGASRAFRYETPSKLIDWMPAGNYPSLLAVRPDGTPWSIRTFWASGATLIPEGHISRNVVLPQRAPTAGDAVRTVTLQLLLPTAVGNACTNANIAIEVAYIDASGAVRCETTMPVDHPFGTPAAIASSVAAWTLRSVAATHSAFRIPLTTSQPVKAGTDVSVTLLLLSGAPVAAANIFVDPVLGIV